ncbi:MAG: tetratricopeptide repeat protein, partial [Pseudomonadota bacterium]
MNGSPPCAERRQRQPLAALLLMTLALLVSACATSPVPGPDGSTAPQGSADEPPAPTSSASGADSESEAPPSRPSPNGATLALLEQSARAEESGQLAEAVAYAERAVRIDPRRADLWTHLAGLELAAGDPETAVRYANKALSLARNRPDWARDAWLVIADAREAQGRSEEADEIRARW